jgi:hypothetical protein
MKAAITNEILTGPLLFGQRNTNKLALFTLLQSVGLPLLKRSTIFDAPSGKKKEHNTLWKDMASLLEI